MPILSPKSRLGVSTRQPDPKLPTEPLSSSTVLWSIVHGSATSPRFQQAFYDAVQTYVRSRDPGAFSKTLTDAMSQQPPAK